MEVVIIGCGYVGMHLAKCLIEKGHKVYGIRRLIEDVRLFECASIIPLSIDITKVEELHRIPRTAQWIINAVSSSKRGAVTYQNVYLEGTRSLINHMYNYTNIEHYIHISSTSVYGQNDGNWVDESSPRKPISKTSQILVETENFLFDTFVRSQFPITIIRSSGIYGKGREVLFNRYVKGEARMIGEGMKMMNMIHVEDLVLAIYHILQNAKPGTAFNASDMKPVSQKDFFTWLSDRLKKPIPPVASAYEISQKKRAITNKKVSSKRLRNELGYKFLYPSFKEGYAQSLHTELHKSLH